ncbi:MAG TPA: response regulator [Holophaga sp.]|nr:response regulator [Holophaga sp.]
MIRVLLVEDDPMVAELNRLYVERVEGFRVEAAAGDAAGALEALERGGIDLVLLDITLPGPDGLDLLSAIRARGLDVDVIPVTASRDTATLARALKLGAADYLIKPFAFERMKQALERHRQARARLRAPGAASQADVDRFFPGAAPAPPPQGNALPKGVDPVRLESVWRAIQGFGRSPFTSEELAVRVGITRVSVRKYLEFLAGLQVLSREPSTGGIGRPVHRYEVRRGGAAALKPYLG